MAEALDTYSDLDMSDSDNEGDKHSKEFNSAADHVKKLIGKLETRKLLEIYALYKQATEGPCNIPRPMWYEIQAKQKWDAWNSLADLPSEAAKINYVKIIEELDPGWNDKSREKIKSGSRQTSHWAAVSSLQSDEEQIDEADKSVYDFCKDGNIWKVESIIESHPDYLCELDAEGLGLIHWAADRGLPDMLKMLLQRKCDVSMRDDLGQTALHYAASCGHSECVVILLEYGADKSLKDDEDLTPLEVANDTCVKQLLL